MYLCFLCTLVCFNILGKMGTLRHSVVIESGFLAESDTRRTGILFVHHSKAYHNNSLMLA